MLKNAQERGKEAVGAVQRPAAGDVGGFALSRGDAPWLVCPEVPKVSGTSSLTPCGLRGVRAGHPWVTKGPFNLSPSWKSPEKDLPKVHHRISTSGGALRVYCVVIQSLLEYL